MRACHVYTCVFACVLFMYVFDLRQTDRSRRLYAHAFASKCHLSFAKHVGPHTQHLHIQMLASVCRRVCVCVRANTGLKILNLIPTRYVGKQISVSRCWQYTTHTHDAYRQTSSKLPCACVVRRRGVRTASGSFARVGLGRKLWICQCPFE